VIRCAGDEVKELEMTCKGICIRHKATRSHHDGGNRYSTGQKRCQICQIFIKWDGLWCPCCGYRLRMKPRNLKSEVKLRARKKLAEFKKAISTT